MTLICGEDRATALVDAGTNESISYAELRDRVASMAISLETARGGSAILGVDRDIPSAIIYLALRQLGVPVALVPPETDSRRLEDMVARLRPSTIIFGGETRPSESPAEIENPASVRVLLQTSGSTGNPRMVQMTEQNLDSNAADIAAALRLTADDVGFANLPLHYSYGLSILNSHLAVGATTVLSTEGPLSKNFSTSLADNEITGIPGVPSTYTMLARVGFDPRSLPALRYMSQAGGRLDQGLIEQFGEALTSHGAGMYVMYGQTEAAPRISTLPHEELSAALGSVGYAMASGRIDIADPDDNEIGEIVYSGPNVMAGYTEDHTTVGTFTHDGPLHTGDLGRLDETGRLFVTGRLKRIAKLHGLRINLDDIERHFDGLGLSAAVEIDESIVVFAESSGLLETFEARAAQLARSLHLPRGSVRLASMDRLPLGENGKVDRRRLADG